MIFTFQILAALLLDLLLGDPRGIPHPVQGIGRLCTLVEDRARKVFVDPGVAGIVAFWTVFTLTMLGLALLLMTLHKASSTLEAVCAVLVLYSAIACRGLYDHSMQVYRALRHGPDLTEARTEIARIVGRDTASLDRQGICRACVETVAENLVDGITAPIFFAVLAGLLPGGEMLLPVSMAALGAYAYKTVNTMDSMYGYKNERYGRFGFMAAKVDDLVNFVPARLSGLALVAAAWLLQLDGRGALKVFLRDRRRHASPNSGHPEAAVAGSLGVQLGGSSSYFGQKVEKPTIGDGLRPLEPGDILKTNRLMFAATGVFVLVLLLGRLTLMGG